MHSSTTGQLLTSIPSSICRHSLWIAVLVFALVLGAPRPAAGAATTFTLSSTWNQTGSGTADPFPIDMASTIVIDTATGQVLSSHVTASGLAGAAFVLPFQSQQTVTGFTLLTFNGGGTLTTGETISIILQVYLPVPSLVGYSGGVLCDATSICNAGTPLNDVTNEVVQCSGSTCQFSEQGTFAVNYGELSGPQTNLTTFVVSASGFCSSFPCFSPVNILGSFTVDLSTGVVTSGSMSMIDPADLKSSPLSLPLDLQFQFPPNQTLFFRKPALLGNISYVELIFPFNSFPTTYSGGPICSQTDLTGGGCPNSPSGAGIGPADQSPALLAVTGNNGDTGILNVVSVSPLPASSSHPVPFVNQPLVPTEATPGGPAFALTVNGSGFVSGATVQWNGAALTTTFVNSSQLTASVPASDIAAAGTAEITVVNPTPGGGLSNVVFFSVSNATRDVAFQAGTVVNGSSGLGNGEPLVAADFAGTGKLDLISAHLSNSTGTVPYWRGNGDGTFQAPAQLQVITPTPGSIPGNTLDIGVGDFNGDGKLDAIVVGYLNTTNINPSQEAIISFLAGNGDGTFQSFVSSAFPSLVLVGPFTGQGGLGAGVAVGDVNGDGHLDVVAACQQFVSIPNRSTYESGICTFLGNGNGTFNLAFSRFYAYPFTVNSIVLGDFNRDSKLDIVASGGYLPADQNPSYVAFLAGNGDGTFAPDQLVYETSDSLNGTGSLATADLDHDGKLDLVFPHDCAAHPSCSWDVDFLLGNGDGTFQPPITAPNFPTFSPPIFGDFNADGNLDVSVLNSVFLLHNRSSSIFPIPQSPNRQIPVVVGDFNGDGRLDLMATLVGSQDSILPLLQVPPAPDFDVAVSSGSQTVTAGGTATFSVTITAANGFNGTVTPSQTGFPAGTTVSYNPPTVTGSGTIVITITTSTSTPPGTYPLAGSLTSGSIVHSGTLTLVVN